MVMGLILKKLFKTYIFNYANKVKTIDVYKLSTPKIHICSV